MSSHTNTTEGRKRETDEGGRREGGREGGRERERGRGRGRGGEGREEERLHTLQSFLFAALLESAGLVAFRRCHHGDGK